MSKKGYTLLGEPMVKLRIVAITYRLRIHVPMACVSLVLFALLTGCKTDVIHLENEKTGERATCGGLLMGIPGRSADAATKRCIRLFREAGFTEVDPPQK